MENPLQLCRLTNYKANIAIIGDIVRIMQNLYRWKQSATSEMEMAAVTASYNWWVPLRSNSVYLPVAVCLTVRLERNKSTRRGAVGNPKPDDATSPPPPLHFHVTVRYFETLFLARRTHGQWSRISCCSSSVRMFTVRVSNTIKG